MISDEQKAKIKQLRPHVRWAAEQLVEQCQRRGYNVVLLDVYRNQTRQDHLFCQGRGPTEINNLYNYGVFGIKKRNELLQILQDFPALPSNHVVTWTLNSKHTQRLAMDIKPIDFGFQELENIANSYGVTQPISFDRFHHEFMGAKQKPLLLSVEAAIKRLHRGISRSTGSTRDMLRRILGRLMRRI